MNFYQMTFNKIAVIVINKYYNLNYKPTYNLIAQVLIQNVTPAQIIFQQLYFMTILTSVLHCTLILFKISQILKNKSTHQINLDNKIIHSDIKIQVFKASINMGNNKIKIT